MAREQLIESLRRECGEKIMTLHEGVRLKVESIGREKQSRIESLREEHGRKKELVTREQKERIMTGLSVTERRLVMLPAENALGERLYALASAMLSRLRYPESYPLVFKALAAELPEASWAKVTVNPEDKMLAAECFPQSSILTSMSISGGMLVQSEDGAVEVDNTFEKRLQRSWTQLLPSLMNEIRGRLPDGGGNRDR